MGVKDLILELNKNYQDFLLYLPEGLRIFVNLFLVVLLIVIYSIFVWKFHRFIAHKNILELNLNQYNRSRHPTLFKFLAAMLFFIEYILILPVLIFIWFIVFSIFLIVLSENTSISSILLIAAAIVASIRMASYYKHELALEIAKLIPLVLLATFLLNAKFFPIERIINHLTNLTMVFNQVIYYLLFIIFLEIILRFFDFLFSLIGFNDDEDES